MVATEPNKIRAMVDTNILVAGIGWPRFPREILRHAAAGDFTLILTPFIIDEANRHIRRLMPSALERFEEWLQLTAYEEIPTPEQADVEASKHLVRDMNDVPIALAAINAQVDYLITQDRDFTDQDESTQELHQRLKIILPGTFLREHMGWTSEALEAIRTRTWSDF